MDPKVVQELAPRLPGPSLSQETLSQSLRRAVIPAYRLLSLEHSGPGQYLLTVLRIPSTLERALGRNEQEYTFIGSRNGWYLMPKYHKQSLGMNSLLTEMCTLGLKRRESKATDQSKAA